jgi:hypothetical protein
MTQITIHSGPHAGTQTEAQGNTLTIEGELYVWDGTTPDSFTHAKTALDRLSRQMRRLERRKVEKWIQRATGGHVTRKVPHPRNALPGIPPWRINAWVQLIAAKTA